MACDDELILTNVEPDDTVAEAPRRAVYWA
jgi:hypothetical protein